MSKIMRDEQLFGNRGCGWRWLGAWVGAAFFLICLLEGVLRINIEIDTPDQGAGDAGPTSRSTRHFLAGCSD